MIWLRAPRELKLRLDKRRNLVEEMAGLPPMPGTRRGMYDWAIKAGWVQPGRWGRVIFSVGLFLGWTRRWRIRLWSVFSRVPTVFRELEAAEIVALAAALGERPESLCDFYRLYDMEAGDRLIGFVRRLVPKLADGANPIPESEWATVTPRGNCWCFEGKDTLTIIRLRKGEVWSFEGGQGTPLEVLEALERIYRREPERRRVGWNIGHSAYQMGWRVESLVPCENIDSLGALSR